MDIFEYKNQIILIIKRNEPRKINHIKYNIMVVENKLVFFVSKKHTNKSCQLNDSPLSLFVSNKIAKQ